MIRYSLTCDKDHRFESWFQSADAFDKLLAGGMISCAVCGSTDVRKSIMAPRIGKSGNTETAIVPAEVERPLSAPASTAEQALKELREKIETNSEDVGHNFAAEARKIHNGEAPERPIYGEAKLQDAKSLIEDGVPVMPLPFMPSRKTN
ncbi:MAG: DUF1178 family protein [Litoreibacter sp.]|nr:DUF1178 family protein [Litoreibacter sp.]